jgi:hypothetical protein
MAVAIAAAVLALPRASVAADALASEATAMSHVRSSNLAIVALIRQAAERSVTFRGLVAAIDASDSIVFVEAGACGHGVRACFVSVSATKSNRYMRVVVDTHKADTDLMGSIGHELRHTLEVIAEPGIRSDAAKYFFYESIGTRGITGPRETRAAITAGDAVRSEISRSTRQSHPH